jgi:hypothetical protein
MRQGKRRNGKDGKNEIKAEEKQLMKNYQEVKNKHMLQS